MVSPGPFNSKSHRSANTYLKLQLKYQNSLCDVCMFLEEDIPDNSGPQAREDRQRSTMGRETVKPRKFGCHITVTANKRASVRAYI